MYTLNRLFSRYGNPGQLPTNMKAAYLPFAQNFVAQLAPEIMRSYLGIVERVVSGEWAASKTKHHMLSFFEEWYVPSATAQVNKIIYRLCTLQYQANIDLGTLETARSDFDRKICLPPHLSHRG